MKRKHGAGDMDSDQSSISLWGTLDTVEDVDFLQRQRKAKKACTGKKGKPKRQQPPQQAAGKRKGKRQGKAKVVKPLELHKWIIKNGTPSKRGRNIGTKHFNRYKYTTCSAISCMDNTK